MIITKNTVTHLDNENNPIIKKTVYKFLFIPIFTSTQEHTVVEPKITNI